MHIPLHPTIEALIAEKRKSLDADDYLRWLESELVKARNPYPFELCGTGTVYAGGRFPKAHLYDHETARVMGEGSDKTVLPD